MEKIASSKKKSTKIRLNLGCGGVRPEGWINTDSSLNAYLQKIPFLGKLIADKVIKSVQYDSNNVTYMDVNNKWKFKSETVDIVYASHLFEHLSIKDANEFLQKAYRVLKPQGIIRLVVPCLYQNAKNYITQYDKGEENASRQLLYVLNLHRQNAYGPAHNIIYKLIHWYQGYPHQHKYMYDKYALQKKLRAHGFRAIKEGSYGQSFYIEEILEVENTREGVPSIYLEAVK